MRQIGAVTGGTVYHKPFAKPGFRPAWGINTGDVPRFEGVSGSAMRKTLGFLALLGALVVSGHQGVRVPLNPAGRVSQVAPVKPPRTVYVLHSGMNDPRNVAATHLRDALTARGISPEDIVMMPNPYPAFTLETFNPFAQKRDNLELYAESTDPDSPMSRDGYTRLRALLEAKGVTPGDNVVWIGHSAGGQRGLTLAGMAWADNRRFNFSRVVCLGSPVVTNHAPPQTAVIVYVSPADAVLQGTTGDGFVIRGKPVRQIPPRLDDNDVCREFDGILHGQWYRNPKVLDRLMADIDPLAGSAQGKPHKAVPDS